MMQPRVSLQLIKIFSCHQTPRLDQALCANSWQNAYLPSRKPQFPASRVCVEPSISQSIKTGFNRFERSCFLVPRLFRDASHDLDFLGLDIVLIVEPEIDVLKHERPDLVTETVGIEIALHEPSVSESLNPRP